MNGVCGGVGCQTWVVDGQRRNVSLQSVNMCIRDLHTNKKRQKALEHFWKENVEKNFRPSIWQ